MSDADASLKYTGCCTNIAHMLSFKTVKNYSLFSKHFAENLQDICVVLIEERLKKKNRVRERERENSELQSETFIVH